MKLCAKRSWVVGTAMVILAVSPSMSAAPPAATVYHVTSTVFDADAFGTATLLQGDDPSSGSATYASTSQGVVSQVDYGNVDWNLDLRSSSRGFYLTVVGSDGSAVAGLPGGPTYFAGRLVSRCFEPSGGQTTYSWFNITDDPNCGMRVNFAWSGSNYTLVMSPGYAGTGLAAVHCNAFSGSSCVDWTVAPNPNGVNAGIANLYVITKGGNEKFVAACKLTFRMHVTYP